MLHTVSDFVGGLWRNTNEASEALHDEEWDSQVQWKHDFEEGDDGIIGELRQRLHVAKKEARLPSNGLHIRVRDLNYTSPPLQTNINTIPSFLLRHFNMYRRVKSHFFPNPSKQLKILSNINFTVKEGSMTLVIGSPGSGKVRTVSVYSFQPN